MEFYTKLKARDKKGGRECKGGKTRWLEGYEA
jgi:hypothetical protein